MTSGKKDGLFAVLFFSAIVIVPIWAILGGIRNMKADTECLAAGYPQSKVISAGLGPAYCIKRIDQTDVVVPLSEVERGKR